MAYLTSAAAAYAFGLPVSHDRLIDLVTAVVSPFYMFGLLFALAAFRYGSLTATGTRMSFFYRGLWRMYRVRQRWPSRLGFLLLFASSATMMLVIIHRL